MLGNLAILQQRAAFPTQRESTGTQPPDQVSKAYQAFVSALWKTCPAHPPLPAPAAHWSGGAFALGGPVTFPNGVPKRPDLPKQVIYLPARFAERGILGWTTLAHELGHDVLEHREGGKAVIDAVRTALTTALPPSPTRDYFIQRASELAADVFGMLLLGPAAAVGLIGYLRSSDPSRVLRCTDATHGGVHPADILRSYLAACMMQILFREYTPSTCEFGTAGGIETWSGALIEEVLKDLGSKDGRITLKNPDGSVNQVSTEEIYSEVETVVQIIYAVLCNEVDAKRWRWREEDDAIVNELRAGEQVEHDARHRVAATLFSALFYVPRSDVEGFLPRSTALIYYDPADTSRKVHAHAQDVFARMISQLSPTYAGVASRRF